MPIAGQDHGGEDTGPVLAGAAMEDQRVIVPFSDDFERLDQRRAERLLADAMEVDLAHVGRVRLRFVRGVRPGPGAERHGMVPRADRREPDRRRILRRVPGTSQVDDGPGADVLFEPGHLAVVHLVERRAPEQAAATRRCGRRACGSRQGP
jgi:hypothetical protein